jgi:hypothetical protein
MKEENIIISNVFWSKNTFRKRNRLINELMNLSITNLYCCRNHLIMTVALQYVFDFHWIIIFLSYLIIFFLIVLFLISFLSLKMKEDLQRTISLTETYNISVAFS